jgi:hypothetical protein
MPIEVRHLKKGSRKKRCTVPKAAAFDSLFQARLVENQLLHLESSLS